MKHTRSEAVANLYLQHSRAHRMTLQSAHTTRTPQSLSPLFATACAALVMSIPFFL